MKQFFKSGLTAKWLLGRLLGRHLNCLFGLAMSKATRQHVPPLAINRHYTRDSVIGLDACLREGAVRRYRSRKMKSNATALRCH
jgi:hypothetical protein